AIVGGSLGARALNEIVPLALKDFKKEEITVTHQCGKGNSEKVKQLYSNVEFAYQATDFIDDMDKLYENHDLIICRAGALTVAEVSCAGIPAIFVPLPTAVDDHQTLNAKSLQDKGAAIICPQATLTAESLYETVKALVLDHDKLAQMSKQAYLCAHTDATLKAVAIIESQVKEK
ncbi:MAG TPA: UDP-N-acetylglucosamine--N-acetylmuramyl-(pentapeptide) pyrophosphoryl-undecaprenol N-acetylglucosamine transferase, partial [Succinivibrio sp.]|nr:UDP-N-acetylglucosamine--N-acetylmuramyl-(pentapeptide) pyrophosphoryl-undecaprenol N-acetylglucosamine transferase [Succinivibrio sp.]